MQYTVLLLALAFGSSVQAHMNLQFPAPLRAAFNPNSKEPNIDYSITSPLSGAAQFPCKGYLPDLSTPGGASVQTYTPGSSYNFTIDGGAPHGGGSCQASLSIDAGKTFKVIHSYIGGCPMNSGQEFDFTVPSDTPAGPAVFAWTWFNNIGNREMYMDCASVTIAGGSKKRAAPAVAFSARPDMFVANIGNGCTVVDNTNVLFPNPGPDVTGSSTATDTIKGTCQAVNGIGGGSSGSGSGSASGSSSPAPVGSSSPATSVAPSASSPTMSSASASSTLLTIQTMPASSSATASATSGTAGSISTGTPSSLTLGPDGMCSGAYTCSGSPHGPCCSQWGWCGSTDAYCGDGCQAGFGQCGNFVNGTGKAITFSRGVAGRRIAI